MPLFGNDEEEDEVLIPTDTPEDVPADGTEGSEEDTPVEEEPNLPDIELIIEDGTGVSDANVYCDLDYALKYCVEKGYSSWTELSENEQKVYLIRGTDFIDNYYNWKGYSRKGQYQSLAFPRDRIYDDRGFELVGIPDKLKKACIEAAYLNSTNGSDSLFVTKDANGAVKKQKVDALEVEYFENKSLQEIDQINYSSIYEILNKLLKGLYKTQADNGKTCTSAMWGC